jgi:predicted MFS family arabinose efflux permease
MLVVQGLAGAVLVGLVGSRLPAWFEAQGWPPAQAAVVAFAPFAAFALLALVPAIFYMRRDAPRARAATDGSAAGAQSVPGASRRRLFAPILQFAGNLRAVHRMALANPRYRIVMTLSVVIRSDFVLMETFLALWVVRGSQLAGENAAVGLARAGTAFFVLRIASMLAPLLVGVLADRLDRMRLLAVMLAGTALSLMATLLVGDVRAPSLLVVVALVGICESGTTVVAQAILGQESPPDRRGMSMATFAFLGTLGVLFASVVGGQLFDRVGLQAPFAVIGALNLVFAGWALKVAR